MHDRKKGSVLVTGGRGFIGRAVGKLLQHSGYRVVSLDQSLVDGETGLREVVADIRDADHMRRVFEAERIGGIIHLAAMLPTAAQRDPVQATEVNVAGSLRVLEMAREFEARRVLYGSSLSVYGTCPAEHVISETDRAAPEDLYGAAKLYVEQLGETYLGHGSTFISLRIGRTVGRGARSATSAWRSQIFELLAAREATEIALPYASVERILLVHVDDVAKALVALLQAPHLEHRVYNAPCESVVVGDLKREVEGLNSYVGVTLGDAEARGNPRRLDCSRFQREFGLQTLPIFEQLRSAAGKQNC